MMKGVGRGGRLSSFAPRRLSGPFPTVPLWVFTGESNASGYALNSDATAGFSLTAGHTALNDVLGFAVDLDAGKVWVSKNGTFNQSQDPANGTTPWSTFTTPKTLYPAGSLFANNVGNKIKLLSGSGLIYSPPSGFSTW